MALRIGNVDDFHNWLKSQPLEVMQVLGHRTAARVLPYVYDASSFPINSEYSFYETLKHIFRLNISAHMLTIGTNTLRKSAVEAAHVAHVAYASAAHAASAAYASDVAYSSDVAYAAFVPNTAANAAASAADTVVWAPLSAEVERIEAGMRPADLVLTPLWRDAPRPEVVETKWQDLKAALLQDDANWQFWIDFYEGILAGGAYAPARIALMDKVAQMPDEFWQKPAREVNAHIAEIYQEFLDNQRPAAPPVDQRGAFLELLLAEPLQTVAQADMLAGQIDRVAQAIRAESNTPEGVELFESMAMQMRQISHIVTHETKSREDKIKALEAENQTLRDTIADVVSKARNSDAPSPGDTIRQAAHELLVEFSKRAGQSAGFIAPVAGLFYLVGDAALVFQLLDAAQKFMPGKAGL